MADNNIDPALPKSPEEVALLSEAIEDLLSRIPEMWTPFCIHDLTSIKQRALSLLIAAGLIERRTQYRVSLLIASFEAVIETAATGEKGMDQALSTVTALMWSECKDAYNNWINTYKNVPPAHFELMSDSWRLTDQGVIASSDLKKSQYERDCVSNFVLKRGFWESRKVVTGFGRLIKMVRQDGSTVVPSSVSIDNWNEGASAMAQAFSKMVTDAVAVGTFKNVLAPEVPVVSFNPTQVQIGTVAYALSEDAAHYLQVLIEHYGERMSDREVVEASKLLSVSYSDRPRLKAVRESMPAEVQKWLDNNNSGTKLRRPV